MVIETSDVRSNPNEQIAHAATVIGKSEFRKKVFEEIHRGKTKLKSISEIVNKTKLDKKKVYEATNYLSQMKIIKKTKKNGKLAYERDDFFLSK